MSTQYSDASNAQSIFGQVPEPFQIKNMNDLSRTKSKQQGTVVNDDELVITKPEHAKLSQTSKNGRS